MFKKVAPRARKIVVGIRLRLDGIVVLGAPLPLLRIGFLAACGLLELLLHLKRHTGPQHEVFFSPGVPRALDAGGFRVQVERRFAGPPVLWLNLRGPLDRKLMHIVLRSYCWRASHFYLEMRAQRARAVGAMNKFRAYAREVPVLARQVVLPIQRAERNQRAPVDVEGLAGRRIRIARVQQKKVRVVSMVALSGGSVVAVFHG